MYVRTDREHSWWGITFNVFERLEQSGRRWASYSKLRERDLFCKISRLKGSSATFQQGMASSISTITKP